MLDENRPFDLEMSASRHPLLQNRLNMGADENEGYYGEYDSLPLYNQHRRRRLNIRRLLLLLTLAIVIVCSFSWAVSVLFSESQIYDDQIISMKLEQPWTPSALELRPKSIKFPEENSDETETTQIEEDAVSMQEKAAISKLSDYEIGEEIGKGGFGKVYLATRKSDKASVAIKVYQDNEKGKRQYGLERVFLSALRHHPYIIKLHCAFEITPEEAEASKFDGLFLLVMDYASNGSMYKRRMDKGAPVRKWFAQLVLALEYVHSMKILHQDIKAGNVLIDENDDARLADFGLAAKYDPNAKSSKWVGTKIYFPPERVRREFVTYSADIYSLGILFYHFYGQDSLPRINKNEEDKEVIKAELLNHSMNSHKWPLIKGASWRERDLYSRMTEPDPTKRITIQQIKTHPYFKGIDWNKLAPPSMQNGST